MTARKRVVECVEKKRQKELEVALKDFESLLENDDMKKHEKELLENARCVADFLKLKESMHFKFHLIIAIITFENSFSVGD